MGWSNYLKDNKGVEHRSNGFEQLYGVAYLKHNQVFTLSGRQKQSW